MEGWIKLHNDVFHICTPSDNGRVIKLMRGWVGHAARVRKMKHALKILAQKPEGKSSVWRLCLDRKIISKCSLRNRV